MTIALRRKAAVTTLVAFYAFGCGANLMINPEWIGISGPHHRLVTSLPREEALAIADELETFRSVVALLTLDPMSVPVPTHIYIFGGSFSFEWTFDLPGRIAGFFLPTPRGNYIALKSTIGARTRQIVLHEYAHFLVRNGRGLSYPRWFDEGLAEFLSTMIVRDDQVIIGKYPEARAGSLWNMYSMPLTELLERRSLNTLSDRRVGEFYAKSWALVHFLILGRDVPTLRAMRRLPEQMGRYVDLLSEGKTDAQAFEAVFGIDLERLDRDLREYLSGSSLPAVGMPLSAIGALTPMDSFVALDEAEIATGLGTLMFTLGERSRARSYYASALGVRPDLSRAYAGLGNVLTTEGSWSDAFKNYERALALDGQEALNHIDYAVSLTGRAAAIEDGQRADLLERAREHLVKSLELNSNSPEGFAMLGATFLFPEEDASQGLALIEHAIALLPSDESIQLLRASALLRLGRNVEARAVVERLVAVSHDADGRGDQVDQIMGELRNEVGNR